MIDKSKIAMLTTVVSFELYHKTSKLFPKGVQRYVIDGTNGMHGIHSLFYMLKKLKNKNIDWLILADEDLIFVNSDQIFLLIKKMQEQNHTVCGIRDGGIIKHRNYNPHVVNTFFTIINLKDIFDIWNKKEVKQNQFIKTNEFSLNNFSPIYEYDEMSLYEPYYCFFLWLLRKNKTFLYIESKMYDDITNVGVIGKNALFYHTWYARSYGYNLKHTKRINHILSMFKLDIEREEVISKYELYKDPLFSKKQAILKLKTRAINRISIILNK